MSAVAMACWPRQQRMVAAGEGRSHLMAAGALDSTAAQYLDLGALARHAVALLHATGHVSATEVRLELPDEPVFARVSRRRLEQVMLHLLADALDARRGEGASARAIRLEVEPQDDFGDYGPTFHVRYAVQGAGEDTPREGLRLVREQVEALGGRFTVTRHGLTGTTVTVELPDPEERSTASW